jgi:hypothetical protein
MAENKRSLPNDEVEIIPNPNPSKRRCLGTQAAQLLAHVRCGVCLTSAANVRFPCGHTLCGTCVQKLFKATPYQVRE